MSSKKSNKQEDKIANKLSGGSRQVASGALGISPRDVISNNFLVEAKTASNKTHTLGRKDLANLKNTAFKFGKIPVYIVEFPNDEIYATIRFEELLALDEFMEE